MQLQHGHKFWRGVAVSGLAVMMAIPATAAFGQKAGHHDPAHDVVKRTKNSDVIAPENKAGDLVHVGFAHTSRRLVTTVRVRDYRGEWHYHGLIKTPARRFRVGGEGQGGFSIIGLFRPRAPMRFGAKGSRPRSSGPRTRSASRFPPPAFIGRVGCGLA
jgi:hypothetical protein